MKGQITKSKLAILISQFKGFDISKVRDEQYETDSESAATIIWNAFSLGDIQGAVIADFGCGTGILGLGCLIMGAKTVYFIDKDSSAIKIAKDNLKLAKEQTNIDGSAVFICKDIKEIGKVSDKIDMVIQNPPFGTKQKHADKVFLEVAMKNSNIVYSFHKSETHKFLEAISTDHSFDITHTWSLDFPIKAKFSFHRRNMHRIKVVVVRLNKE